MAAAQEKSVVWQGSRHKTLSLLSRWVLHPFHVPSEGCRYRLPPGWPYDIPPGSGPIEERGLNPTAYSFMIPVCALPFGGGPTLGTVLAARPYGYHARYESCCYHC